MLLLLVVLLFRIADACSPFSMDNIVGNMGTIGVSSGAGGARARGQSTLLGQELGGGSLALGTSSNPPITSPDQLNCEEFDNTCRWRNMEGLFVDELDWFQGSGHLDQGRLQVATGTSVYPDGSYAIVATDTVQLPTAKAILVSDQIACQSGPGILRFMYWTSPEVRIKACTKPVSRPFPEFSFCSPSIEAGDPGPASVQIPALGRSSFQLFIVADNFVFHAVNLQGGFAIVDSLEYEATMCTPDVPETAASHNEQLELLAAKDTSATLFPTLGVQQLEEEKTLVTRATPKPWSFSMNPSRRGPIPNTVFAEKTFENGAQIRQDASAVSSEHNELAAMNNDLASGEIPAVLAACEALTCSFNESQPCVQFAIDSKWRVSRTAIGNPLTGIKGDASQLPFNKKGYFAFTDGPLLFRRLSTAPFYLDRNALFVFSYHKVDKASKLRLVAKKAGSTEEMILFEAPRISKDARRWFREGRDLTEGQYDYLAFEIRELAPNNYVGVDEWMIVDESRRAFCSLPQ